MSRLLRSRASPWPVFFNVFFIAFLLVVSMTALLTFILPVSYSSIARIKVETDITEAEGRERPQGTSSLSNSDLMQKEIEMIQSPAILDKVIRALDLNTVWGRKLAGGKKLEMSDAMALLKDRLEVCSVGDTNLIEIRVFGEDPHEAADVANRIAEVYCEYRLEKSRQSPNDGDKILKGKFDDQVQRLRKAQKQVDQLREEFKISDVDAARNSRSPIIEADVVRRLQGELITYKTMLVRDETSLNELTKLTPDRRRDALQTSVGPDTELNTLLAELGIAEQTLLSLKKDYAPDHLTYQTATAMAEDSSNRVALRVEGTMIGLANRVEGVRAIVGHLKTELDTARETDIKNAESARPYFEAKQRLEDLQRYRAILAMKLASGKIEEPLLRCIPAEIVDRAVPGTKPVRPNMPVTLLLGAVGGEIMGLIAGAVAALVALLIRRSNARKKSAQP